MRMIIREYFVQSSQQLGWIRVKSLKWPICTIAWVRSSFSTKRLNLEVPKYLEGRVSGAVFSDESSEEMKVYAEVFKRFAWSNPLWPKLFPGVRKMEAEVVRMCCDLMNGGNDSCGTVRRLREIFNLKFRCPLEVACLLYWPFWHIGTELTNTVLRDRKCKFEKSG